MHEPTSSQKNRSLTMIILVNDTSKKRQCHNLSIEILNNVLVNTPAIFGIEK